MQNLKLISNNYNPNDDCATSIQVERLLSNYKKHHESVDNNDDALIKKVKDSFPIITNKNGEVRILGLLQALNSVEQITNFKTDKKLKLSDLENIDFKLVPPSTHHEMYFNVANDSNYSTIYNAKNTFLDYYDLAKHANYLLKNGKNVNLLDDLNDLQSTDNLSSRDFIYRFIQNNGSNYLRAIVSKGRYKFYDNSIALYIAISVLSQYIKENNRDFICQKLIVTDSKLYAYFLEKESVTIRNGITIQTGLILSNSELGDGAASFNAYYVIRNSENKKFVGLNSPIASINHGNNPIRIEKSFEQLNKFEKQRIDAIAAVEKVKFTKKLTRDDLSKVATLISRHMPMRQTEAKHVKDRWLTFVEAETALKNTFSLMDLFDKLNSFLENEDPDIQLIMESRISRLLRHFVEK